MLFTIKITFIIKNMENYKYTPVNIAVLQHNSNIHKLLYIYELSIL
jgi:hypothetical protein